jgi:hypothetical protein
MLVPECNSVEKTTKMNVVQCSSMREYGEDARKEKTFYCIPSKSENWVTQTYLIKKITSLMSGNGSNLFWSMWDDRCCPKSKKK